MTYAAPKVTAAGLTLNTFVDIQTSILNGFLSIYGETNYLGNDAADYEWISIIALKLFDNEQLCQLDYNQRSPLTAVGSGLDSICKLNGIARLTTTPSSAVMTLGGTPFTTVTNAVIQDVNGILWDLPSSVVIGSSGSVMVNAICEQSGAISAAAGTINNPVGGFTAGWTSVTNSSAAIVGTSYEADSAFRARQAVSVATPSETRLAGTISDVKAVNGVTRTNILENQTSVTDSYGNEGHSLTCVVEGGVDLSIATAIYGNRGIGCNTQGATIPAMTIISVTDPNSGTVTPIGFVRPVYVTIYIIITIHGLTSAFNTSVQTQVINAVTTYLNSLEIGEEVTQSALYAIALSVMPNLSLPIFSVRAITLGLTSNPTTTADIVLAFYQASVANVTLTVI